MASDINIIVTREYISPARRRAAKGKTKYYIYRNDPGQKMSRELFAQRCYDRGLGNTYGTIMENLDALKTQHVEMWAHVVSPAAQVLQLVSGQEKETLADLADEIIVSFYEALGFEQPLYTTLIHDAIDPHGLHRWHAHVLTGGSCPDAETGEYRPVYIRKQKGHFDLMDQIREQVLDQVMTRRAGLDWKKRIPALPGSIESFEQQLAAITVAPAEPIMSHGGTLSLNRGLRDNLEQELKPEAAGLRIAQHNINDQPGLEIDL